MLYNNIVNTFYEFLRTLKLTQVVRWHDLIKELLFSLQHEMTWQNFSAVIASITLQKWIENPKFGELDESNLKDPVSVTQNGRKMYSLFVDGLNEIIAIRKTSNLTDRFIALIIERVILSVAVNMHIRMNKSLTDYVLKETK